MTEYITAWECIGCGRIEASRPCIGVCQDRKAEFVYARDYEEALRSAEQTARALRAARDLLEQLTKTKPRSDQWERCFSAFQSRAKRVLSSLDQPDPKAPSPAEGAVSFGSCPLRGRKGGAAL